MFGPDKIVDVVDDLANFGNLFGFEAEDLEHEFGGVEGFFLEEGGGGGHVMEDFD